MPAGPGATLPCPQIIDPFVEVEVIGLPVDCSKEQTRVVDDNGEGGQRDPCPPCPGPRHSCHTGPAACAGREGGEGRLLCPGSLSGPCPLPPSYSHLAPRRCSPRPGSQLGGRLQDGVWARGPPGWSQVQGDTCSRRPPGFNPMWEETLVFMVHMPEVALVRFLVWDHDPIGRDFIGQRTLALSSMMPGGRGQRAGLKSPAETSVPAGQPRGPGQGGARLLPPSLLWVGLDTEGAGEGGRGHGHFVSRAGCQAAGPPGRGGGPCGPEHCWQASRRRQSPGLWVIFRTLRPLSSVGGGVSRDPDCSRLPARVPGGDGRGLHLCPRSPQ